MITWNEMWGILCLAFTALVVVSYAAGVFGYRLGKRDAFEDGPEWPSGRGDRTVPDRPGRHRSDQDDVRLPSSAWLDTVPLAAVQRPLAQVVRLPAPGERHRTGPATDFIAAMRADTDEFIAHMNGVGW